MDTQQRSRAWWKTKRWWVIALAWGAWLALIVPMVGFFILIGAEHIRSGNWSKTAVEESQARGDDIIAALQRHRAERGQLPKKLADLVPTYLDEINPPMAGNGKWLYRPRPDGSISLAFEGGTPRSPICFFEEATTGSQTAWFVDTR